MSSNSSGRVLGGFFDFSHFRGDLYGGLTTGVIALPMALAFGEASGAGPIAGVWGAIFTGFFAAMFGGTKTQITGPTGPMVVVFAGVFASLSGNPALVFGAVVLAGVLQILLGAMRAGQYIRLVPYPVISGFMTGIGVIIILLQASRLLGHEPDGGGTIPALTAIPDALAHPNVAAAFLGLFTMLCVFLWPKSVGKYLPAPLAALIIGTLIASVGGLDVPVIGDALVTGLPQFVMPNFTADTAIIVIEAAIILAALGAIDSLLTSLVADNMTRTRHDSNQELIGQGIGNTFAGLFGVIPGAGATMRTVVNIKTGGMTKLSGMIHSVVLVIAVLIAAPLVKAIPHTVLAGILVKVGWDIVDVAYIKRAHKGPRWDLVLMALVLIITVFVDLITAVGVGVFLAGLAFVKSIADEQLDAISNNDVFQPYNSAEKNIVNKHKGHIQIFEFSGPLSFGAAVDLSHQIREKSKGAGAVILDFTLMPHIDVSAARAVESIVTDTEEAGTHLYAVGVNDDIKQVLDGLGASHGLPDTAYQSTREAALLAADGAIEAAAEGQSKTQTLVSL